MNTRSIDILEFAKIRDKLADCTVSGLGRALAVRLQPMTHLPAIKTALEETTEARAIMAAGGQVPLHGLSDIHELLERVSKGGVLNASDLNRVADFLRGCRELKRYMQSKRIVALNLSRYADSITPCPHLEDEIYAKIDGATVLSSASPQLAKLRKEIQIMEDRIQAKLQSLTSSSHMRDVLQESLVSFKDGRYVLPVKSSQRNKIDGFVVASSGSGSTVFIEPTAVRKLTNDLQALRGEEEQEEFRILSVLSNEVAEISRPLHVNLETMAAYDFTFAKGRLSWQMDCRAVNVNDRGHIDIRQGRHPLLSGNAVPLELALGNRYRTLIITGPNTGGKTVALKTVGLLTLMAQAGLHVPVGEDSQLAVFATVLADIGDGQNIEQSLSTFSSHVGNIAAMLKEANGHSLVLMDEVGTGTDPAEGAALAMAILEEFHQLGAVTLATTHYSDVKRLADTQSGFLNGRMDFDPQTLKPLYRLILGEAGSSHAFWIAERLGISDQVMARARQHLQATPEQRSPAQSLRKQPEEIPAVRVEPAKATVEADVEPASPQDPTSAPSNRPWALGDSVLINALDQRGVIAELPNAKGEMVIFTRGRRITVNHKRVTLLVAAEHLYPPGYDLKTVLYTWDDRKLMRDMDRKLVDTVRVISEGVSEK